MQTFLPFDDFVKSAKSLDSDRLGKQRVEVKQLLIAIYFDVLKKDALLAEITHVNPEVLLKSTYFAHNHPAKKMWDDYPFALITYGIRVCEEWKSRRKRDSVIHDLYGFASLNPKIKLDQSWLRENNLLPPWLGNELFHASHRGNLIRKDKVWYGFIQNWTDDPNMDYIWP